MFDWNFVGQMPGQTPNQMPGACPMAWNLSDVYRCLELVWGPNQMSGPCLDPNGSNGFQGQMPNGSTVPGGVTPQMSMYQDVLRSFADVGTSSVSNGEAVCE